MKKIVFFSIPAHGHTNPTIPIIEELTKKGHQVWYYSFLEFRKKIEEAGATFIACDEFLPQLSEVKLARKVGKDFAALIEMVVDTTLAMEEKVCEELKEIQPDCIIYDSLCLWGKLFAKKLDIKSICSTTSFAFNQHTAKLMKPSLKEVWKMMIGMPKINKKVKSLRKHGYTIKNMVSMIQNDNQTDTIVYTSKEFQPLANTFSERYFFVGPSIQQNQYIEKVKNNKKVVYISLGTILNQNPYFYEKIIQSFANTEYQIIMSVGEKTNISTLKQLPKNFTIKHSVNQVAVLQSADVFITHCGMNSVSESLYFGVPMILFPQHSEQMLVADRVEELGAGVKLEKLKQKNIVSLVDNLIYNENYRTNARKLSRTLQDAGGTQRAAHVILTLIS